MYSLILIILCKERKEGKKKGRKVGVHVPLDQHVKHRKSLSGLRQLLLHLLQASLSSDECCVGLLRVKETLGEFSLCNHLSLWYYPSTVHLLVLFILLHSTSSGRRQQVGW